MRKLALFKHHSLNNFDLANLTLPNHFSYATKWGYDLLIHTETYENAAWGLIPQFKHYLSIYDTIVSIGSDVIFTNFDIPITNFIDRSYAVVLSQEDICRGGCEINGDLIIWNNNERAFNFLEMTTISEKVYKYHKWLSQGYWSDLIKSGYKEIKILPCRQLQSAPYINCPMSWQKGDFSLHFLGMDNQQKYNGCKKFLETGEIIWH